MIQTQIIRPNLRRPDDLQIALSLDMLLWLETGLLEKCKQLNQELAAHDSCDMFKEDGCRVREQWMIDTYGSIKEAIANNCKVSDCSEDLAFRYKSLAEMMDFITQSRYMRNTFDARSMRELDEVEKRFLNIKGELAYRREQADVPTGTLPKLTDEELAKFEAEHTTGNSTTSLLNLTQPPVPSDNIKPPAGKLKVVK